MQTLNVGAGRTDEEYKAAEDQRRADLLDESRSNANYFFVAAGLAAAGTGLLPVWGWLHIFFSVGTVDLLALYGGKSINPLEVYGALAAWVATLAGLGFAAKKDYRWAFLAGVVLYGADMIALGIMFSLWSIGVHAFFVLKWFQGQKALADLKEAKP